MEAGCGPGPTAHSSFLGTFSWAPGWAAGRQKPGLGSSCYHRPPCLFERAQTIVDKQTSVRSKFRVNKVAATPSSVPHRTGAPGAPASPWKHLQRRFLVTSPSRTRRGSPPCLAGGRLDLECTLFQQDTGRWRASLHGGAAEAEAMDRGWRCVPWESTRGHLGVSESRCPHTMGQ